MFIYIYMFTYIYSMEYMFIYMLIYLDNCGQTNEPYSYGSCKYE